MAMIKKYIEDKDGNQVLPITHFSAVKDSDGNTLEDILWEEKEYDPTHYSGMGKVVLKKNMVSGVNTLTQAMIQATNTIYVIRYDFTLGEDITVPSNCVLEFEGGSIAASGNNETITGANTGINAGLVKILNTNVTLAGTWNVAEAYPEWFGAKGDGTTDDTNAVNSTIDSFPKTVLSKDYKITSTISCLKDGREICGRGTLHMYNSRIQFTNSENLTFRDFRMKAYSSYTGIVTYFNTNALSTKPLPNSVYGNIVFENLTIDNFSSGYREAQNNSDHTLGVRIWGSTAPTFTVENIYINNCHLIGSAPNSNNDDSCDLIYFGGYISTIENIKVTNCTLSHAARHAISLASNTTYPIKNVTLVNNYIKDTVMAGVDVEYGANVNIVGNTFIGCGNDTTYSEYTAAVPIRSAVANYGVEQENNVTIASNVFKDCYNSLSGFSAQASECYFENAPVVSRGLAQMKCTFDRCELKNSYISTDGRIYMSNCTVNYSGDNTAITCRFKTGDNTNVVISGCRFNLTYTGSEASKNAFIFGGGNISGGAVIRDSNVVVSGYTTIFYGQSLNFELNGNYIKGNMILFSDGGSLQTQRKLTLQNNEILVNMFKGGSSYTLWDMIIDSNYIEIKTGCELDWGLKKLTISNNIIKVDSENTVALFTSYSQLCNTLINIVNNIIYNNTNTRVFQKYNSASVKAYNGSVINNLLVTTIATPTLSNNLVSLGRNEGNYYSDSDTGGLTALT